MKGEWETCHMWASLHHRLLSIERWNLLDLLVSDWEWEELHHFPPSKTHQQTAYLQMEVVQRPFPLLCNPHSRYPLGLSTSGAIQWVVSITDLLFMLSILPNTLAIPKSASLSTPGVCTKRLAHLRFLCIMFWVWRYLRPKRTWVVWFRIWSGSIGYCLHLDASDRSRTSSKNM